MHPNASKRPLMHPNALEHVRTHPKKMKNTELIINPHRELVLELFSSSKIFIYPSTYFYEQQPSVIIEALSFHIPVVAYKWRGINNLIKIVTMDYFLNLEISIQSQKTLLS